MEAFEPPPPEYLDEVSHAIRSIALHGRGDNARGRNLAALYALDYAYRNDWLTYVPSRDPARWIVMVLDLLGAHAGLGPADRIRLTLDGWMEILSEQGLPRLAEVTRTAVTGAFSRRLGVTPPAAEVLAGQMSAFAVLWRLEFDPDVSSPAWTERHVQGKLVRKKISQNLDALWCSVLREYENSRSELDFTDVLAAIPPSFQTTFDMIEATLSRVQESLVTCPFAVYYALATDASKGGRIWDPPASYVEGSAYSREDFERSVGRRIEGGSSKKRRFARSVALAELGLSATFPATIATIDRWLATWSCSELWLAEPGAGHAGTQGWWEHARDHADRITAKRWEIHEHLAVALEASRHD